MKKTIERTNEKNMFADILCAVTTCVKAGGAVCELKKRRKILVAITI